MSLTTAITVFVKQAVRQKKIPFEVALDTGVSMRDAMAASERIWQNSVQNGTDKVTAEEIDAEIAAARTERKSRIEQPGCRIALPLASKHLKGTPWCANT